MAEDFMGPGGGGMAGFAPEAWFWEMPPVTRCWVTACAITSVLVQCKVITPLQLFYSYRAVLHKSQYWRLFTPFVYFGPLSLDLVFHVYFLQRYSKLLETSLGHTPSKFAWLLFCAAVALLVISPLASLPFLGSSLSSTLVYVWARRNPQTHLSFLGLLVFTAPYLPFILMIFSYVIHSTIPKDEILGVIVGHVFWFLEDVFPGMYGGQRPMDPPGWWKWIFEGRARNDRTENARLDHEVAAAIQALPRDVR